MAGGAAADRHDMAGLLLGGEHLQKRRDGVEVGRGAAEVVGQVFGRLCRDVAKSVLQVEQGGECIALLGRVGLEEFLVARFFGVGCHVNPFRKTTTRMIPRLLVTHARQ